MRHLAWLVVALHLLPAPALAKATCVEWDFGLVGVTPDVAFFTKPKRPKRANEATPLVGSYIGAPVSGTLNLDERGQLRAGVTLYAGSPCFALVLIDETLAGFGLFECMSGSSMTMFWRPVACP
jgi:hypothetical protein